MNKAPIATCTCGTPLVISFLKQGYEWVCMECGNWFTYFGANPSTHTDELEARYNALDAEYRKLLLSVNDRSDALTALQAHIKSK